MGSLIAGACDAATPMAHTCCSWDAAKVAPLGRAVLCCCSPCCNMSRRTILSATGSICVAQWMIAFYCIPTVQASQSLTDGQYSFLKFRTRLPQGLLWCAAKTLKVRSLLIYRWQEATGSPPCTAVADGLASFERTQHMFQKNCG